MKNELQKRIAASLPASRRPFTRAAGAAALAVGLVACSRPLSQAVMEESEAGEETRSRSPNVVLIVADDLGYGDVCAYSCRRGRTPNLDRLAAQGVRFTRGYVTAPICSPSRAALLTGRYQQRFGHEFTAGGEVRAAEEGLGTPASEALLPELLREAGYATGMVGKWHIGATSELHPLSRGFDEFFGFLHGATLYAEPLERPGIHHIDADPSPDRRQRSATNPILRGREPVAEPEYLTDAFTREAVDFLRRHAEEPFFLYVAYNAPHTPLQVTDRYYDRFPHIEDEAERIYAAMVSALDDGVGEILSTLAEEGVEEDTLVFFLSDNGCATYTGACSNGELLGGKLIHFEGGTRVPFIARWKGVTSGSVVDSTVSALDVMPTVLEAVARAKPPEPALDGRSLLPVLHGEVASLPARDLYWRSGRQWAMQRADGWKLVHLAPDLRYLFDVIDDPAETENVAAARPDLVEALEAELNRWGEGTVAPLWGDPRRVYISLEDVFARRRLTVSFEPKEGLIELTL